MTNENVFPTLNSFPGDKVLTINPTNQQKLAEGSNHSQDPERKSGNYFFKSDATCTISGDELQRGDPASSKEKKQTWPKGNTEESQECPCCFENPRYLLQTYCTHKLKEGVGTQRTSKSFGSETTEGHQTLSTYTFPIQKTTPLSGAWISISLTFYLKCHIHFTECVRSPLFTYRFPPLEAPVLFLEMKTQEDLC